MLVEPQGELLQTLGRESAPERFHRFAAIHELRGMIHDLNVRAAADMLGTLASISLEPYVAAEGEGIEVRSYRPGGHMGSPLEVEGYNEEARKKKRWAPLSVDVVDPRIVRRDDGGVVWFCGHRIETDVQRETLFVYSDDGAIRVNADRHTVIGRISLPEQLLH